MDKIIITLDEMADKIYDVRKEVEDPQQRKLEAVLNDLFEFTREISNMKIVN